MQRGSDWRAIAMVAAASSSWGLWSLFLRPTGLPATVTSPMLFLFMAVWAMPWALRAEPVVWTRRLVWLLVGNSVFDAINVLTFFAAIERTTVAIAVLTHYAAPVLIALGAPLIDRVRVPGAIAASLVAVAGLALVLEPWRELSGGASSVLVGGGLGLASAFAYAGNVFVVRRLATEIGGVRAMTYHAVGAAVLLAPLAVPDLATIELADVVRLGVGSIGLGTIAGIAYLHGLVRIGATRAAMLTLCEPLVAVLAGWWVWSEPLGPVAAVGAFLVLGAALAVARGQRRTDAKQD